MSPARMDISFRTPWCNSQRMPPAMAPGSDYSARPSDAVAGVDAVYTDTWTSMGKEPEAESRRAAFAGYQVTEDLMSLAKPEALLHALPAGPSGRRGDTGSIRVSGLDRVPSRQKIACTARRPCC